MTRNTKRRALVFAAVAILAGAAGILFNVLRMTGADDDGVAEALMAVRLADVQGRTQALSQWRGKVLVINLWATWCPPCREEIPAFIRLQDKFRARGLQFVGIAIDHRDRVRVFARDYGINYPILLGGLDTVELSRRAGNHAGALPFTLVIDRDGKIAGSTLGRIKEDKFQRIIESLL